MTWDLCLCATLYPPSLGGPAYHLPRLAARLAGRLKLLALVPEGSRMEPRPGLDYETYRRRYRIKYLDVLTCELALASKILSASRRARVMYFHGAELALGILRVLGLFNGRRSRWAMKFTGYNPWERAVSLHPEQDVTLDEFCGLGALTLWRRFGPSVALLDWLFKKALRGMDRVVTPGRYLARMLVLLGVPESRIRVVHNPVPLLDPAPAKEAGLTLITACRLVRHKGLDELIRWVGARPEATLWIVGDGDDRERLTALAAPYSNVSFLGAMDHAALHDRMRRADLFVLNSAYEGFSHVLLESASLGRAFAASRVPGNEEVMGFFQGKVGALFDRHDEAGFWRAVDAARRSPVDRALVAGVLEKELGEGPLFDRTADILMEGTSGGVA